MSRVVVATVGTFFIACHEVTEVSGGIAGTFERFAINGEIVGIFVANGCRLAFFGAWKDASRHLGIRGNRA